VTARREREELPRKCLRGWLCTAECGEGGRKGWKEGGREEEKTVSCILDARVDRERARERKGERGAKSFLSRGILSQHILAHMIEDRLRILTIRAKHYLFWMTVYPHVKGR
jgi:hypothetical protein